MPRKPLRQVYGDNAASFRYMQALSDKPSAQGAELIAQCEAKANKPVRSYTPSGNESESDIQKNVMHALSHHATVAWVARFNSGSFTYQNAQGKQIPVSSNTQRGMSDLLGMLIGGRMFAIEVKSATGQLQEHQSAFLEKIKRGGGIAGVARCVADAIALIE